MSTTPKMTRLGPRSLAIAEALHQQLRDQYSSESALLSEAVRRGLLLLAVEAWHDEAGQYGGHSAVELARLLKHELTAVFNFLLEQDQLPAMLRVSVAPTPLVAPRAAEPVPVMEHPTAVAVDAAVIESVQLGGQDEDWDD